MRVVFLSALLVFCFTKILTAQLPTLEETTIQLDLDVPVTVPVGETTLAIFLPGYTADPFGPTPPNGDLVVLGGNQSGPAGLIASQTCGLVVLTDPGDFGFPNTNFLIYGVDASGKTSLSNHIDTKSVDPFSGLACLREQKGKVVGFENLEHADNAHAQKFVVRNPVTVESVVVGVEYAAEGNYPLGVDSDGDGIGDSPPILDGLIPVQVMFFFGITPKFNSMGPIIEPDAQFDVFIQVDEICKFAPGDVNQDGVLDLIDVSPFVELLISSTYQCEADVNDDDTVDLLDVEPFVEILLDN